MTDFDELKERLMQNPEVAAEYERLGPKYALLGALWKLRADAKSHIGRKAKRDRGAE